MQDPDAGIGTPGYPASSTGWRERLERLARRRRTMKVGTRITITASGNQTTLLTAA